MSELTAEQMRHLSELMDQRYAREMEQIAGIAARSQEERGQQLEAGRPAEQVDAILAELARATDFAMLRQDLQDARDIIAARRRIAAGSYGDCIDCDEPIAYARLEAYPTAKRCISCQSKHEERKAAAGRLGL